MKRFAWLVTHEGTHYVCPKCHDMTTTRGALEAQQFDWVLIACPNHREEKEPVNKIQQWLDRTKCA